MKHYDEINIGDKLVSESSGGHPVTVTGFTDEGDYITDELDFHEYIDEAYFVIKKDNAIRYETI